MSLCLEEDAPPNALVPQGSSESASESQVVPEENLQYMYQACESVMKELSSTVLDDLYKVAQQISHKGLILKIERLKSANKISNVSASIPRAKPHQNGHSNLENDIRADEFDSDGFQPEQLPKDAGACFGSFGNSKEGNIFFSNKSR